MNNEVIGAHWNLRQGSNTGKATLKPIVVDEYQNDIAAVMAAYHISAMDYRDLSRQHSLNQALSRWPLLFELTSQQVDK